MGLFRPGADVDLIVIDAQRQARTSCDVPIGWQRPKVPAKSKGRKGTRRAWKRAHPPHMAFAYREPTDMLTYRRGDRLCILCTPAQRLAIEQYRPGSMLP